MVDSPEQSFEEAVDSIGDDAVTSVRELKEFPLCPKGMHKAKCIKVEKQEREYEGRKYDVLSLTWELETTFEDEVDGKKVQKNFRLFDSAGLSYGPKSKLYKIFKELTGEEIKHVVTQKPFTKDGKRYVQETLKSASIFLEMKAEILVKHNPSKKDPSKIYANIESYSCNDEVQKHNADLVFEDGAAK